MTVIPLKQTVATVVSFIAAVYIFCAAFVMLAPTMSLRFFNLWFHGIDLAAVQKMPVFSDVLLGFFNAMIVAALLTLLFVTLWNYFHQPQEVNP